MKAVVWAGVNEVSVEEVPEPRLLNVGDALVRVLASATCGSDLHLIDGYIPGMRSGDVLGHEFLGEIVETGPGVRTLSVGDVVVVASPVACGQCWFCTQGLYSSCDNGNPQPAAAEALYGFAPTGFYGYSHVTGGFAGSHAEYVRVPFADVGCFKIPDGLGIDEAVYASDAVPTGWMGASFCDLQGGETVAVWGAGAVGQMAARSAYLQGAERVVIIDRRSDRLEMAAGAVGAEPLHAQSKDVMDALLEITAGRGPDACIEAVGMEADSDGIQHAYDRAKQVLRLSSDRLGSLRQAIMACRKSGIVSVIGVFGGIDDKFPMGAVMNKCLTIRAGQQRGQAHIPMLLDRMASGEISTAHLTTHPMSLDDAVLGYDLFKHKRDGCVRVVFHPTQTISAERVRDAQSPGRSTGS
jgi:threonine dehydrogenase-like Zn-dependent dehydrogenase